MKGEDKDKMVRNKIKQNQRPNQRDGQTDMSYT